jgi:putative ABC transport system ATP-binding protein
VVVLEALERIHAELGTTTVIITHNADIAHMANRVLYLADGRIARIEVNATRKRAQDLRW